MQIEMSTEEIQRAIRGLSRLALQWDSLEQSNYRDAVGYLERDENAYYRAAVRIAQDSADNALECRNQARSMAAQAGIPESARFYLGIEVNA